MRREEKCRKADYPQIEPYWRVLDYLRARTAEKLRHVRDRNKLPDELPEEREGEAV